MRCLLQVPESQGPSLPHLTYWDLIDLHAQVGSKAARELMYHFAEHPCGHSGINGTPLEGHSHCHYFFSLHLTIILNSLELLRGKIVSLLQHTQTGQSGPPAIFFLLCGWHPDGCCLPVVQPLDFDVAKTLILSVKKGSELPPPSGMLSFICR